MKVFLNNAFNKPETTVFKIVNDLLALLTFVSILAIVLETVHSLSIYEVYFRAVEYVSVFFFSLEYLGRIIIAPSKIKYVFSFFGLIDLISVLPTFLHLGNLTFLKSARILRLLRLLRVIRLAKVARLATTDSSVFRINLEIYFLALFGAILFFGSLMYAIEAPHQGFESIPEGMLWSAGTIFGGGIAKLPLTLEGQLALLLTRFAGLVLLGLLIHVIGNTMKTALFGNKDI